jgi:N-methylhydantoinase B
MRHHPFLSFGLTSFVVTHSEAVHINAGIIRCIDLVLPEASVVNSRFPASCGMRITTAMRIHDMVLGALAQALPGTVPAGGGNTLVITYISTSELGTQGRVVVANPVPAGSGGGPDRDGISGTDFSVAFLRNVPVEVLESEAPVLVRKFGLLPDSEGPGRYCGGFGLEYELEIRHPSAVVVMRGKDRHSFSSWGVAGGRAGAVNGNDSLVPGAPKRDIGKRTVYRPELHEVIRLWSGGGGGYGDPLTRDPVAVARDVAAGLVSRERASEVYGVVLDGDEVDREATRRLRNRQSATGDFDFGQARDEWERVHGLAAEHIAAWLPSLPVGVRRYAQAQAYQRLHARGPGPYGNDEIAGILDALHTELCGPVTAT